MHHTHSANILRLLDILQQDRQITIRLLSEDLNIGKTACQDILPGVDRKKTECQIRSALTLEQKGGSFYKLCRTLETAKKDNLFCLPLSLDMKHDAYSATHKQKDQTQSREAQTRVPGRSLVPRLGAWGGRGKLIAISHCRV